MAKFKYLTAPVPTSKMPPGIPYIIGNEAAERFSFYGMKTILVIFMVKYLMGRDGNLAVMGEDQAKEYYHLFTSAVYFTPLFGALLSDVFFGKYKTILSLSIVYCLGHLVLALDDTRIGLAMGLTLIAMGSGGIKPCVSANVGDQFGKTNQALLSKVFSWFYFSINLGSFFSTLLTPWVLEVSGPHLAFGIPGILMLIATIVFWMGRKKFVHIPPSGKTFFKETFSRDGLRAVLKLCVIYVFIAMFWALYDQSGSSWVLQAEKMDRYWLGFEWLSSQIQAANPLLVMMLIPLFSYLVYPAMNKCFRLTELKKISIGFFVMVSAFLVITYIQSQITGGDIFKFSSQSPIAGSSRFQLLDGKTDISGWSSSAPTSGIPQEVVIRLRQRKVWDINSITVYPKTILSPKEIEFMLKKQAMHLIHEQGKLSDKPETLSRMAKALQMDPSSSRESIANRIKRDIEILEKAAREAIKAGKEARKHVAAPEGEQYFAGEYIAASNAAKAVAVDALEKVGENPVILDDHRYYPREIAVFAGDFSGKYVPSIVSDLVKEKNSLVSMIKAEDDATDLQAKLQEMEGHLTDPCVWLCQNGWSYLGDFQMDNSGKPVTFKFKPIKASHILIQIKSNYGAERVKISEIAVNTVDKVPDDARAVIKNIWPNVAAIGYQPRIVWQIFAYILLTAAEVMVSITSLEFSYTQAPPKMKSLIMALYLLAISAGNAFTALVNLFIQNADGSSKLEGSQYFWFFSILMMITSILFIFVARNYKVQYYIQEETPMNK